MLPYLSTSNPQYGSSGIGMAIDPSPAYDQINSRGAGMSPQKANLYFEYGQKRLGKVPKYYSGQRAAEMLIEKSQGVGFYTGNRGRSLIEAKGPAGASGITLRTDVPIGGNYYHIGVANELNTPGNMAPLQTLAHEIAHHHAGHTTSPDFGYVDNGGEYTNRPYPSRAKIPSALKEVEAETISNAIMNRLGYGDLPGLKTQNIGYVGGWNNQTPRPITAETGGEIVNQSIRNRADSIAQQLVPEQIRRFGPISTTESAVQAAAQKAAKSGIFSGSNKLKGIAKVAARLF